MNHAKAYLEYAGLCEETHEDGDWSRLEKFRTDESAHFTGTGMNARMNPLPPNPVSNGGAPS